MARFESEATAFHPARQIMDQSIIKLLTKTGFSALVLASAQTAGAITLTYTATQATYDPNPNSTINTRPLQLSTLGNALTSGTRNYIYQGLSGDNAIAGAWTPVGQTGPLGSLGINEQRFDYLFPAATAKFTNPTTNLWIDNVTTDFGSFFLAGTCSFCGAANTVQLLSTTNSDGNYIGLSPTGAAGNQNYLNSDTYNIVFGASGITGTIQFDANTNITSGSPVIQTNSGKIVININQLPPTPLPVPGPLPLLGAGAAFGFSRRLRRQIKSKQVVKAG
jgi:hypothetical protein